MFGVELPFDNINSYNLWKVDVLPFPVYLFSSDFNFLCTYIILNKSMFPNSQRIRFIQSKQLAYL